MSKRFSDLVAYVPGEQPQDQKYIKLNTNESPYPPSPEVLKLITAEEIDKLRLYGDPEYKELRKILAGYLRVKPENIFLGNGSDEVLSYAFMAYCDKNNAVSYPDISYGFYSVFADLYGISKNEIPLREDYSIKPADYYDLGTTIVLANPNAPTGMCISVEDIERIVKRNPKNIVVIDEAYIDFGAESCVPLTEKYNNLLVVQTYSKSRSFAGGRLGFAVGSTELIEDLEKLRYSTNPYNINRLTALAGIASIRDQAYYDKTIHNIIRTRDYTTDELKKLGFEVLESKTNFVFVKSSDISGQDLYAGLRKRGILVRYFDKARIDNFVRITIGTSEQMVTLISAVKEILNDAQSRDKQSN